MEEAVQELVFAVLVVGCKRNLDPRQSLAATFAQRLPHTRGGIIERLRIHPQRVVDGQRLKQGQVLPVDLDASGELSQLELAQELKARSERVAVISKWHSEFTLQRLSKFPMLDSPVPWRVE